MASGNPSADGKALCTSCGLCCDGTLFRFVLLEGTEIDWARRRRLPLFERNGQTSLQQPCTLLNANGCSAYSERPQRCQKYECSLLRRLKAGDVPLDTARATVQKARRLSSAIPPTADDVGGNLDIAALRWLLVREFETKSKYTPT